MQPSSEPELTAVCRGQGASVKEPLGHPGELLSSLWLQETPRADFSHCGMIHQWCPGLPFGYYMGCDMLCFVLRGVLT